MILQFINMFMIQQIIVQIMVFDMTKVSSKSEDMKIQEAVEKNDEEWQKRMLLLVIVMIVAILRLD